MLQIEKPKMNNIGVEEMDVDVLISCTSLARNVVEIMKLCAKKETNLRLGILEFRGQKTNLTMYLLGYIDRYIGRGPPIGYMIQLISPMQALKEMGHLIAGSSCRKYTLFK